jgi:hypothetical protein
VINGASGKHLRLLRMELTANSTLIYRWRLVESGSRQRFRKAPSAFAYAADLTPVVAAKEASASWNARGMAETA